MRSDSSTDSDHRVKFDRTVESPDAGVFASLQRRNRPCVGEISVGDSRTLIQLLDDRSVDLSFWSPPYFVGKSYEQDLTFEDWQALLRDVIAAHSRILRPGAFMVVNIADILCFADDAMPRFQADNVTRKTSPITREDVLAAQEANPDANRHGLAAILGCSEQTVQRRLEGNNVRGGKHSTPTRVLLTASLVESWALASGLYLYDRRVWHKDPCWANSRWHSNSYRAVDEFEHVLVFWQPGVVSYDRSRLTSNEWSEWGSRAVWRIASVRSNDRHEAEFPEELARRVIRLFSPAGGLVLDPFVGSGTTTAVAAQEGRRWIGFEMDSSAAELALHRTIDEQPLPWNLTA
ncbi:MAG: site-specific DNA-methyltransferase [Acidimicrobiaceae bacterium]|nr:site-specific DNA-methyltransferase [Acidimicrobiaceae bacterium]MYG54093.1 site-specific DNA-methyltransferase [Acidimicrobiaceae bacterium]MYK00161.1 site-specific DNA-methyltransferase [Acidimicrobiaceae bacterium]